MKRHSRSLWKGLAAGAVGGLVGTIVMTEYQNAITRVKKAARKNGDGHPPRQEQKKEDPATVKAAQAIAKSVSGKSISDERKEIAGQVVHYAMGIVSGAVYGMLTERARTRRPATGLLFGTGVWAIADEVAVPALKLSDMPWKYPASIHANALAAHLVYGGTTWAVARGIRASL